VSLPDVGSKRGDEPIKFGKFPADVGSDQVIRDSAHEVPYSIGGFDGALFGLDVIFNMARGSCLRERQTEPQFSLEKVNERPLRLGAQRFLFL
jgi:hypothetical protein